MNSRVACWFFVFTACILHAANAHSEEYGQYPRRGADPASFDRRGLSPESTARTLVHDTKGGMRVKEQAIKFGDLVIPHIQSESKDYSLLDDHNSSRIADVLGSIDSELARKTLAVLYTHKELKPRLVGAIGLGMHKLVPNIEEDGSFLTDTVASFRLDIAKVRPGGDGAGGYGGSGEISNDDEAYVSRDDVQLAIVALGYSENIKAIEQLHLLLEEKSSGYWLHALTCQALARLRFEEKSIPILRDCMAHPEFQAIPDAFRVLISFGDRQAVPLAIHRVSKELQGTSGAYVIDELSRVTGRYFVYDKGRWSEWWGSVSDSWEIPDRFLVDWDAQPKRY